MLAYQFIEYCEKGSKSFEEIEENMHILFSGVDNLQDTMELLNKVIFLTDTRSEPCSSYINNMNQIFKQLREDFDFFNCISFVNAIKNSLSSHMISNNINDNILEEMWVKLDGVFSSYGDYLKNHSKSRAYDFLEKATGFINLFRNLKKEFARNLSLLTPCGIEITEITDEAGILDIQLLEADFTLEKFGEYLNIISEIYYEFQRVISSEKNGLCDLKIVKIESGSFMCKLLGDKNIVEAFGLFFNKFVELIFSKYTREGQIEGLSQLRTQVKEDTELSRRMKELGYDTTSADESIEKAFAVITKKTYELAQAAPKVRINENEYSLNDIRKQEFLPIIKNLYIEEKDDYVDENGVDGS